MIHETEEDEKTSDTGLHDKTLDVSNKNRYTPYKHQGRSNPTTAPKDTHKQPSISGAAHFSNEQPNKQEKAASVITDKLDSNRRIFNVIYGKDKPYKIHKVFSDDGYLLVMPMVVELRDENKKLYALVFIPNYAYLICAFLI